EPPPQPQVQQADVATPPPQERPAEAQRQSAPSVAQAARRAKGEGGEARGQSGQSSAATLSPARSRALMAEWGARIRARIARGVPRGAGRGTAVVNLTVAADGRLVAVRLAQTSGDPRIDQIALAAVRRAGRFPAAPGELGLRQQSFTLPVRSR
ncbi:TonB family protein, partial [Rhodovulum adriaticum]